MIESSHSTDSAGNGATIARRSPSASSPDPFGIERRPATCSSSTGERPIILLGVPRSGTTLLRVLLGSHPKIQAASETPWICGGYGLNSLRHLAEYLAGDPTGPIANMSGVVNDDLLAAARSFATTILRNYRIRAGKDRVVIKTPDDLGQLEFLLSLFPDADYIHIIRDGRDVACSSLHQKGKLLGDRIGRFGELSLFSALERWKSWDAAAREAIGTGRIARAIACRYEDLVTDPQAVLARICDFIRLAYVPQMLAFAEHAHDLPAWEAGSQDVRRRPTIDRTSVGQWKRFIPARQFSRVDAAVGDALAALGYRRCCEVVAPRPPPSIGAMLSLALSRCARAAHAIARPTRGGRS